MLASMHRSNWLTAAVLAISPTLSAAGVRAESIHECAPAQFVRTGVNQNVAAPNSLLIHDDYVTNGLTVCAAATAVYLKNEADGPALGTTIRASSLPAAEVEALLRAFTKIWGTGLVVWHSPLVTAGQCDGCEQSPQLIGNEIFRLPEGSPSPQVTIKTQAIAEAPERLVIPFVVARAGDDDWLEMSNRGRVFWRMPVAQFEAEKLYFAEVPREFIDARPAVWIIYLNGDGATDSVVYAPYPSAYRAP